MVPFWPVRMSYLLNFAYIGICWKAPVGELSIEF
jgi:hypothetical protein